MQADALATTALVLEPTAVNSILTRLPETFQARCLLLDPSGRCVL
jgi:hypothetical protein